MNINNLFFVKIKKFFLTIFSYNRQDKSKEILYLFKFNRIIDSKLFFLVLIIKIGIEFFFAKFNPFAFLLLDTTNLILIGKL